VTQRKPGHTYTLPETSSGLSSECKPHPYDLALSQMFSSPKGKQHTPADGGQQSSRWKSAHSDLIPTFTQPQESYFTFMQLTIHKTGMPTEISF